jgi:UPF0755 protein
MVRIVRRLAALVLLLIAAMGLLYWSLEYRYAGFQQQVFVDIPRGTGARSIARLLTGAGVIRHEWQFLAARALRPGSKLQAGEYRFQQPASVLDVFDRMVRGDVFYFELPVPEGNNMFDIAAALEARGIMDAAAFVNAARDAELVRDLDPQAPTLEGYLFPDTYRLTRHTGAAQLCRMMVDRFRKAWRQIGSGGTSVHDTVTLASLIEKEARLPVERPMIASVFVNRLHIGMPLQCDPTTIYAALLEDRYHGTIYRSDLDSKQLYNTYQHAGLPPGPIANPGLDSLNAALHPEGSDYIYFVARPDGSGGHQFSKDLAGHVRAVRKYRRGANRTVKTQAARRVPAGKPS